MQYMLLIYDDEALWESKSEEERSTVMQEYFAFTNELKDTGKYVSADPLQPSATAKQVRVRDGELSGTDGPFAETKEQLGGYYIVDVDSEEEALEWAAKIPSARYGTIEVRAIMPVPAGAEAHA
jgi:hypothetical protein